MNEKILMIASRACSTSFTTAKTIAPVYNRCTLYQSSSLIANTLSSGQSPCHQYSRISTVKPTHKITYRTFTSLNCSTPYNLIFLRHGQSTWNRDNRFIGWTDTPLTDGNFYFRYSFFFFFFFMRGSKCAQIVYLFCDIYVQMASSRHESPGRC